MTGEEINKYMENIRKLPMDEYIKALNKLSIEEAVMLCGMLNTLQEAKEMLDLYDDDEEK